MTLQEYLTRYRWEMSQNIDNLVLTITITTIDKQTEQPIPNYTLSATIQIDGINQIFELENVLIEFNWNDVFDQSIRLLLNILVTVHGINDFFPLDRVANPDITLLLTPRLQ
jgi:hypothetical protein